MFQAALIKCIWPVDHNRAFLGVELGKIVEIATEAKSNQQASTLIYSGSHTVYDLVLDCKERILFFDASFALRAIGFASNKTEQICQGEYWGSLD